MEYYTPKETGYLLNLNEDTICNRIKAGIIPAVNANQGGKKARYRIDKTFIDNLLYQMTNKKPVYRLNW